jgi:hypothetical protein
MTIHQWDASVLRVVRGKRGFWEVTAASLEAPLFHFRTKQDATSYAEDIARAQPGISVEVCGEDPRLRGAGASCSGLLQRVPPDPRSPLTDPAS